MNNQTMSDLSLDLRLAASACSRHQANLFVDTMSFLLILSIIIICIRIQSPALLVYGQSDVQYQNCSVPFSCGNISDIGYPFWGSNRPEHCGHPMFELNCTDPTAVITIENLTYQVLHISSENQTMKLARTDYIGSICPDNFANTTLNTTYFSYGSDIQNVTLYYGCPTESNHSIPPNITFQFTCDGSNGIFVTSNSENLTSGVLFGNCSTKVIVPASASAVATLERNLNSDNVVGALEQGFEVKWQENATCQTCELSGGVCGSNSTSPDLFACYCIDGSSTFSCGGSAGNPPSGKESNRIVIRIGVGAPTVTVVVALFCCCYCFTRKRGFWKRNRMEKLPKKRKQDEKIEEFIMNYVNDTLLPKRYSYSSIKKITNSFHEKLGQGGFAEVYKGKLPDGRFLAVKMLIKWTDDGEEFINEVASISRTSHVNVVKLLGFCYEGNKRALIYEYMPNGSLDKYLWNQKSQDKSSIQLGLTTLYEIAIGIARGLEYLHRGCNTRIVHFDMKPHNVLLDEDFCPKISDFGLAKLCKGRESILSTFGARGTAGYIAPEVFLRNLGGVSYKSDVYSYGMMILEMFGENNNIDIGSQTESSERYFPDSIYKDIEAGRICIDKEITDEEEETVSKVVIVGLWCIQTRPTDRPSMTKVVEMLEGNLQTLQIPPSPCLFSTATVLDNSCSDILIDSSI